MSSPAQSFRDAVMPVRPQPPSKPTAQLKAQKRRATDEPATEDTQNEFAQSNEGSQLTERSVTGIQDLLLAQADTAVVSDAAAASASSSAAAATAPAVAAPAAMATGLSGTTLIFGGLGVLGLAAAAGGSSPSPTPTKDTTAPVFTAGTTATTSVAENTATTSVVHTAAATDNVAVTAYAFADGGADNDKFSLDTATGELRFKTSPNFEAPASAAGSNAYTVKVKAVDAAGNSTVQTVTVTVTDTDDTAPVFTAGTTATTSVAENTATTSVVHTAAATDNVAVTAYAFADGGADNDKFSLDTATGELRFKTSPNFEAPASAAGSNAYTVKVKAVDAAGNSTVQTVTVTVTDTDDTAPVFTAGTTATTSVAENTATTSVVHTAAATDNVAVTAYAFADGGADNDKFSLDPATGELRFKTSPNFEAPASAAGSNVYTVKLQARDAAGNTVVQTLAVTVTNVNDAPVNTLPTAQTTRQDSDLTITGLQLADADPGAAISVKLSVAHGTIHVAGSPGVVQSGTGTDDNITLTGTLADVNAALAAPGAVVYRGKLAYVGADTLQMQATDGGNPALSDTDSVAIAVSPFALTSAQTFDLWQETELAWLGDASKNINALNQYASVITAARDATSADGSANQPDATKRLSQYINQVTSTDIVSDAEFDAGFAITGKAAAGAQASLKFLLDKDRTTGADGEGAQVLSLGANDVDNADGDNNHATGTDVTANYDNTTGDWSLVFAPGSAALLQATHNTWGSGVHQLLVDTDGNGSRTGSGATAEASRLFLVASGTAKSSDTGTVAQNYSVQDKITNDVFVYYYGDPDGAGIGLWTELDDGDSASNQSTVSTNKDGNTVFSSDWDYYNNTVDNTAAVTTPVTASNTALHLVTNMAAQTWEFHMGANSNRATWDVANAQATEHTLWGSNTSRQASLTEAIALYAANFGGDGSTRTPTTVGAAQPMSNAGSTNDYTAVEDNRPGGWDSYVWSAAPTPLGHAPLRLNHGFVYDSPDAGNFRVSAVL